MSEIELTQQFEKSLQMLAERLSRHLGPLIDDLKALRQDLKTFAKEEFDVAQSEKPK